MTDSELAIDEIGFSPAITFPELSENQKADALTIKTHELNKKHFDENNLPYSLNALPPLNNEYAPSPTGEAILSAQAAAPALRHFPNLSWEMLTAGLTKLNQMDGDLHAIADEIEKIQKTTDDLLKISQGLSSIKVEDGEQPIPESLKEIANDLKAKGFDIFGDHETLSNDKIQLIKSDLDKIKNNLQTKSQMQFTKVQTTTPLYNSLLETLRGIQKSQERLEQAINNNAMKR